MAAILGANSVSGEFTIANSASFGGAGTFLKRTQSDNESDTDRRKFTFSIWIKPTTYGSASGWFGIWSAAVDSNNYTSLKRNNNSDAQLIFEHKYGGTSKTLTCNSKMRDYSAWLHIVVRYDSTDGTEADRAIIYVNGERQETTSAWSGAQNQAADFGHDGATARIGAYNNNTGNSYMGTMSFTEAVMTVGYAYGPETFGKTSNNGEWIPKNPGVAYSANGFRLQCAGTGTSANSSGIGADTSGNDNHFTIDNQSGTSITGGYTDTPSNNFAVFNPLYPHSGISYYAEGNTRVQFTGGGNGSAPMTFGLVDGKWYWETKIITTGNGVAVGVVGENVDINAWVSIVDGVVYVSGGQTNIDGTEASFAASFTDNDIIGCQLDLDSGTNTIEFFKNGSSVGSKNLTSGKIYFPAFSDGSGATSGECQINTGNPRFSISSGNADGNGFGNFEYAPASGFLALCTKNLGSNG